MQEVLDEVGPEIPGDGARAFAACKKLIVDRQLAGFDEDLLADDLADFIHAFHMARTANAIDIGLQHGTRLQQLREDGALEGDEPKILGAYQLGLVGYMVNAHEAHDKNQRAIAAKRENAPTSEFKLKDALESLGMQNVDPRGRPSQAEAGEIRSKAEKRDQHMPFKEVQKAVRDGWKHAEQGAREPKVGGPPPPMEGIAGLQLLMHIYAATGAFGANGQAVAAAYVSTVLAIGASANHETAMQYDRKLRKQLAAETGPAELVRRLTTIDPEVASSVRASFEALRYRKRGNAGPGQVNNNQSNAGNQGNAGNATTPRLSRAERRRLRNEQTAEDRKKAAETGRKKRTAAEQQRKGSGKGGGKRAGEPPLKKSKYELESESEE